MSYVYVDIIPFLHSARQDIYWPVSDGFSQRKTADIAWKRHSCGDFFHGPWGSRSSWSSCLEGQLRELCSSHKSFALYSEGGVWWTWNEEMHRNATKRFASKLKSCWHAFSSWISYDFMQAPKADCWMPRASFLEMVAEFATKLWIIVATMLAVC